MLQSVIFDMDGVIVDSEQMHADANAIALVPYGLTMPAEYYLSYAGTSKYRMMEILIEKHHLNATADELCRAADRENDVIFERDGFREVPGVVNLIKMLSNEGISLAIASSSPYEDIYMVTDYFDIRKYFDVMVSGFNGDINPKPAPDIYNLALKKLGFTPEASIAIEDTDTGLLAAHRALLTCIGYRNPLSGNQTLEIADAILEDYSNADINYFKSLVNKA